MHFTCLSLKSLGDMQVHVLFFSFISEIILNHRWTISVDISNPQIKQFYTMFLYSIKYTRPLSENVKRHVQDKNVLL